MRWTRRQRRRSAGGRTGTPGKCVQANYFRLMRVIVDVATALKPDLAVVDGMVASDHGMDHEPVETNVLLAGHDPVATDAVGAAVMGFDPESDFPNEPFLVSENHLRLAAKAGVGRLCLSETDVRGLSLAGSPVGAPLLHPDRDEGDHRAGGRGAEGRDRAGRRLPRPPRRAARAVRRPVRLPA